MALPPWGWPGCVPAVGGQVRVPRPCNAFAIAPTFSDAWQLQPMRRGTALATWHGGRKQRVGKLATRGTGWSQKDASAAVLVTGTAIGGGFLALPYTSAPSGFVPSALVMLISWALLLFQAHVVTDLLVEESRRSGRVVLASVFGNASRGKRCRCKSDASPSPAVGTTKLLVDGDTHSVEDVEDAIKQLEQTGTTVHTTVFAPAGRDKNKNWMQFLRRHRITFRPVEPNSSKVGEATDGAIKCALSACSDDQSLALLTSDYDFIDAIQQLMDRGRRILVFVPSKKRIVIERYQSAGVQVQEVKPRVSIFPKVRAVLRSDGSGHVQLDEPCRPWHDTELVAECKSFLGDLGYMPTGSIDHFVHSTTKFWRTNELGSITVFPLQIGIKQVCQQMQHHGDRKWRRYANNLAFFLPKSPHGAKLNKTQTDKFGTGISKALFDAGGPFLLNDSVNLVGQALRRLGYVDDDLNTDLQEAMFVFVNASKNKYNLRKPLDALPSPTDTAAELEDKLRYAFLSHLTDGQWLPAPKDGYIRQHLCKQGFLANVKAARREVFRAMARYARQHQLPEMKTYNGYVNIQGCTSLGNAWSWAFEDHCGPVLGGRAVVSWLFLLLMMATLVSQFAKAGSLLSAMTGLPEAGMSAALAAGLSALTWRSSSSTTASVNGWLTLGFVIACVALFAVGVPLADWSRLNRASWLACLPSFPTILQLFVYLEVIPTLGTLLKMDAQRMKRAILIGSVLLLVLELAWSGLGLGLVPFVRGLRADPVDVLLGQGGPVSAAVLLLGCCAVSTTILGTNLALRSFF
eukprot:s2276_g3.t3